MHTFQLIPVVKQGSQEKNFISISQKDLYLIKAVSLRGVMDLQHSLLLDDVATVDNHLDCDTINPVYALVCAVTTTC